jgi:hypothetical protein
MIHALVEHKAQAAQIDLTADCRAASSNSPSPVIAISSTRVDPPVAGFPKVMLLAAWRVAQHGRCLSRRPLPGVVLIVRKHEPGKLPGELADGAIRGLDRDLTAISVSA